MKDWTGNSKSIFVCNGASNHSQGERHSVDYYATEPRAMKARYEDNEELLSMEKKLQISIGNRLRNAFNKDWHAGYAEGVKEALGKIANAVMTEAKSEEEK